MYNGWVCLDDVSGHWFFSVLILSRCVSLHRRSLLSGWWWLAVWPLSFRLIAFCSSYLNLSSRKYWGFLSAPKILHWRSHFFGKFVYLEDQRINSEIGDLVIQSSKVRCWRLVLRYLSMVSSVWRVLALIFLGSFVLMWRSPESLQWGWWLLVGEVGEFAAAVNVWLVAVCLSE